MNRSHQVNRRKPASRQEEEANSLRRRALELLNRDPGQLAEIPPDDLQALLHELAVQQIELERQNRELHEARQELERTQAEYASLYDHAPVGYLTLAPDGRIERLNLMAAELLGLPRERLIGAKLARFVADRDRDTFLRKSRHAMEHGGHHACKLLLQTPGGRGTHAHFECRLTAASEVSAQTLRITLTDISERLRAEEQLHISRRQLEAALQASECGLWDWPDVTQDEAWWSPEFYRLLGYEVGELRPGYNAFRSLLHPEDREQVLQVLNEHTRRGDAFDMDFRLRTRDGAYRWFHGNGRIIYSGDDKRHMAGLLQDITKRREAAEAVQQAMAKTEQANTEKTRFLAAASHDLRQPLQSLSLYLNALKRMHRPPVTDEVIAKMQQSVNSMGQLLRTLLNISRLDAGIVSPEPVSFPVQGLFDEILVNHGPSAAAAGLELRAHRCRGIVYSDPVLLEEIVQNFVTNALRNTDRGGVLLGCRRRGDRLWIQVWDTGIGIPADRLPALLTPADTEDERKPGDGDTIRSGLGLAIVRQTADLLGYRLDAASVPGRGSVFAVEVPLTDAGETVSAPACAAEPVAAAGRPPIVLVVDNDTAILDACRSLSPFSGYRFECTRSQQEALDMVAGGLRPDLLLCDLRLRRSLGSTVIRRLRAVLERDVPAILLTGDTSDLDDEVHSLTRCRILYKPVEFETLSRTMETLLERPGTAGPV